MYPFRSFFLSLLVVLAVLTTWYRQRSDWQQTLAAINLNQITVPPTPITAVSAPVAEQPSPTAPSVPDSPPATTPTTPPTTPVVSLTTTIVRQLPFSSQAPSGNWDAWHEETCEEASLIIAWRYWLNDNRAIIPVDEMEGLLQAVAAYERDTFGTDVSTTIAQMRQTLTDYYQLPAEKLTIQNIASEADLLTAVQQGVVVAPFAGKLLHNPNFRNGGPRYHVAVITGYDGQQFIVHDVGTRNGANYRYTGETLMGALHDYIPENQGDITAGVSRVLILQR
ncbi:MAG: C39 family peptidase [bacterium]|nr:C39 family peptidase [bacterium]